jgi:hypothetical protein
MSVQGSYHATPTHDLDLEESNKSDKHKQTVAYILLSAIIVALIVAVYLFVQSSSDDCVPGRDGDCDPKSYQTNMTAFYLPAEYTDGTADGIDGIRALCNDLSEPPYYFKPANEGHERDYVLYFPGGSGCWDEETCDDRWETRPDDMIANPDENKYGRGITNSDQKVKLNPFADWNMMFADYCSSDAYVGRVDIDDPDNLAPKWHFGGNSIFWGVIQAMINDQGLCEAENVIVTASSAGAEGLFQQMDRLVDKLNECPTPPANVKFAFDNGWHVYNITVATAVEETETRQAMADSWKINYNDNCIAQYPEDNGVKCLYTGTYLWPQLENQGFYLHMHEFDFMQESGYGISFGNWMDWDDDTYDAAITIAHALVDAALETDAEVTYFSFAACREHDDFDKTGWVEEGLPAYMGDPNFDQIIGETVYDFMFAEAGATPYRVYDDCFTPYCNPTCALLPYDSTETFTFT